VPVLDDDRAGEPGLERCRPFFWTLLVAVVLIMLLLIARLVRGGAEPAGAESVQG
jgi:hypothetical protein